MDRLIAKLLERDEEFEDIFSFFEQMLNRHRVDIDCWDDLVLNWRLITGPMGHQLSLISELSIWPISR